MFFIVVGIIYVFIEIIILFRQPINIYPEIFYYPWLVAKGLIPYRDFFDHHGFLLDYIFAYFIQGNNITRLEFVLKMVFIFNQILLLLAVKIKSNKLGFILIGGFFIIINYFLSKNLFWFEHLIVTFYLLTYLTVISNIKRKELISGILILFASFIKPNAAIIIFPLLFYYKNFKILLPLFFGWILIFVYFYINQGLTQLISYLFLFNKSLPINLLLKMSFQGDRRFLIISLFYLLFLIFLTLRTRKLKEEKILIYLIICSIFFLFVLYGRVHLLPIFTFISILSGIVIKNLIERKKFLYLILVCLYFFIINIICLKEALVQGPNPDYISSRTNKNLVAYLQNNRNFKKFYVLSNAPEYYFLLNQLPPVKMSIIFYSIYKLYFPDIENELISELKSNQVDAIIVPLPIDNNYSSFAKIKDYINSNFIQTLKTSSYIIYLKTKN